MRALLYQIQLDIEWNVNEVVNLTVKYGFYPDRTPKNTSRSFERFLFFNNF